MTVVCSQESLSQNSVWFFTITSGGKKQLLDLAFITHLSSVQIVFCAKKKLFQYMDLLWCIFLLLWKLWLLKLDSTVVFAFCQSHYFYKDRLPVSFTTLLVCSAAVCVPSDVQRALSWHQIDFQHHAVLKLEDPSGPAVIYRAKAPSSKLR